MTSPPVPPLLFESPCAEQRLSAAVDYLRALPARSGVLIVAETPAAAQWLVARALGGTASARFNWHRKSLTALVDELALPALAKEGRVALRGLGRLGLCTRVVQRLAAEGQLGRYAKIAPSPGFVRALAQTLSELRLSRVSSAELVAHDAELAQLLRGFESELDALALADDALALTYAAHATSGAHRFARLPLLLLDVELLHLAEAEVIAGLAASSPSVCATFARGDERSEAYLRSALSSSASVRRSQPSGQSDLARLQAQLFAPADEQAEPIVRGAVHIISCPGESREAVEVARAILEAAAGGVAFDRVAVALRAVEVYRGVVEEAFTRAQIPAHFAEGVQRPLPQGRALLLLLECARNGLSLRAFSEYLSLFVFPRAEDRAASASGVEAAVAALPLAEASADDVRRDGASRWERLLRQAGVGGDAARWQRRLLLLGAQLSESAEDPHSEERERDDARRDLSALDHLIPFVTSLLAELSTLATASTWGALLARLERVATLALAEPDAVCEVLHELLPLADVGPVQLVDVERVLSQRLRNIVLRSAGHGAGKVFVGTPQDLRGRSFERVFVMGLAEQLFPPRLSEDPLLPDRVRKQLSPELALLDERAARERLALRISVGAAERQLCLTYPRFDAEHGRPRVPSFYGLAVLHAMDGSLPAFDELARRASQGAAARMGFPAPDDPVCAIDDAEYDLAVLGQLLRVAPTERIGGLRYLLSHVHLARALRFRAWRWMKPRFTAYDGFVAQDEAARELISGFQLDLHAYSASSLALIAACPYRFYLQAICGLRAREPDDVRPGLGPRERGVLMHRVQQVVLSRLSESGQLPLEDAGLSAARALLHAQFTQLSREMAERRGLGATRAWAESLASLLHDLDEWLRLLSCDASWIPQHFELGFGVTQDRAELDAHSTRTPVSLGKLKLAGVIDLVERRAKPDAEGRTVLRVTDHKSGAHEDRPARSVTQGGRSLQPLLYALALEQLVPGAHVEEGRLYFCTSRGDFEHEPVPLDATARAVFADWLSAVDALLRQGLLPAAPAKDACAHCPGLAVCGPYEEKERVPQVKAKDMKRLGPLFQLRNLP